MYKKIVVGTDLSETAGVATAHAAALAEKLGAELVLLHAGEDPGSVLKEMGEKYGAEALAVPGNPAEVLLTESEKLDADLLVVGSVGMSGAKRFMLGNVPNKVSHHFQKDLLIVKTDKGDRPAAYKKILVGTDGSPTAMRAVEMASELAGKLKAELVIACAYEPISSQEQDDLRAAGSDDPIKQWGASKTQRGTPEEFKWRIAASSQADDVLDRAMSRADKYGVGPELRAIEGSPAHELLSIAKKEDFDLIAVGSVGMSGSKRFMLGNVPHRLSHHAATDVLILHTA
jgi:nucleotide-binding universal stress UspA family protein